MRGECYLFRGPHSGLVPAGGSALPPGEAGGSVRAGLDHHLAASGQLPVEVTGGDRGTEVCQLSLGDIDRVILEISDGGVHGVRASH